MKNHHLITWSCSPDICFTLKFISIRATTAHLDYRTDKYIYVYRCGVWHRREEKISLTAESKYKCILSPGLRDNKAKQMFQYLMLSWCFHRKDVHWISPLSCAGVQSCIVSSGFLLGSLDGDGDAICGGGGTAALKFDDIFLRLTEPKLCPGLLLSGRLAGGTAGFLEKSISKVGLPGRPTVFLKGSWAQVISACFSAFSRS